VAEYGGDTKGKQNVFLRIFQILVHLIRCRGDY